MCCAPTFALQKKEATAGEKPEPVRTHLRDMVIVPEMIGSVIGVYNGKTFNQVEIKVRLTDQRWRLRRAKADTCRPLRSAAGDGWHLHWRVLHLVQAREARPPWHRRDALLALHPAEVSALHAGVS